MKKWSAVFLALFFFSIPKPVSAHAFGKLYNLPVPFWLYAYGGAAAIIVSFLIIGYFLNQKKAKTYPFVDISEFFIFGLIQNRSFTFLAKSISVFLFILTIITGLFGDNSSYSNFNMTFFWIIFVLGFTYSTGLIGNFYSVINPFKMLVDTLLTNKEGLTKYPSTLSYWPAFALYFIFIWIELIGHVEPSGLSLIIVIYTLVNIVGATFFGSKDWFKYGEFFSVFFNLISKISFLEYKNGKFYLRIPFTGIEESGSIKNFSLLLFILFMLSSTAFDGFKETTSWYRFYWSHLDDFIRPIFAESSYPIVGTTVVLLFSPFFFLAIYLVLIFLSKSLTRNLESTMSLALKFGYTLIPIAFVYNVAHYYTLVVTQGQEIVRLISDPFGFGWNLFGTIDISNNFIPDANFVWHSQVAILLIGHIASVYLSHKTALSIFPTQKEVIISQIPMLILMVTYTVIGLWILSQPITLDI